MSALEVETKSSEIIEYDLDHRFMVDFSLYFSRTKRSSENVAKN